MKGIFANRTREVLAHRKSSTYLKESLASSLGIVLTNTSIRRNYHLLKEGEKLLYAVNHTIPELTKEEFVFSVARVDFVDYTAQSRILRIFA